MVWRYSRNIHHEATIQYVAETALEALRTLIGEDQKSLAASAVGFQSLEISERLRR
jgi:hypothetical protein